MVRWAISLSAVARRRGHRSARAMRKYRRISATSRGSSAAGSWHGTPIASSSAATRVGRGGGDRGELGLEGGAGGARDRGQEVGDRGPRGAQDVPEVVEAGDLVRGPGRASGCTATESSRSARVLVTTSAIGEWAKRSREEVVGGRGRGASPLPFEHGRTASAQPGRRS